VKVETQQTGTIWEKYINKEQDAQLSQRDRATGCISFGQRWKIGTGRHYCRAL